MTLEHYLRLKSETVLDSIDQRLDQGTTDFADVLPGMKKSDITSKRKKWYTIAFVAGVVNTGLTASLISLGLTVYASYRRHYPGSIGGLPEKEIIDYFKQDNNNIHLIKLTSVMLVGAAASFFIAGLIPVLFGNPLSGLSYIARSVYFGSFAIGEYLARHDNDPPYHGQRKKVNLTARSDDDITTKNHTDGKNNYSTLDGRMYR